MKYLIGNKKDGIIDFRESLYYWILFLIILYTLRAIIALSNGEEYIYLL